MEMKVADCCSMAKDLPFTLTRDSRRYSVECCQSLSSKVAKVDVDKLHSGADKKKQTSGKTMSKRLV